MIKRFDYNYIILRNGFRIIIVHVFERQHCLNTTAEHNQTQCKLGLVILPKFGMQVPLFSNSLFSRITRWPYQWRTANERHFLAFGQRWFECPTCLLIRYRKRYRVQRNNPTFPESLWSTHAAANQASTISCQAENGNIHRIAWETHTVCSPSVLSKERFML